MFHGCKLNNKKNRLHERLALSQRNMQVLITELYKVVNGLFLKLVSDCLKLINMTAHNARNSCTFCSRPDHTVLRGKELFSQLERKIWKIVSNDMENPSKIKAFKNTIKQWKPHACPCRLCKAYIYQVGFI